VSRLDMVDVDFVRHACVECDRCGVQRTLELAETKGWLLEEKDLCEHCREQPKRRSTQKRKR